VANEKEQISGIFFLSRFNLARRKNSSLPLSHSLSLSLSLSHSHSSSSCGTPCPLPSPPLLPSPAFRHLKNVHPRTPVRVHRVRARGRRRGASRRNIDVPLEHQIESVDRNDDAPRNGACLLLLFPLRRPVRHRSALMPPRCRQDDPDTSPRRCLFVQALSSLPPRYPMRSRRALTSLAESDPKARQTMRSPSEAPAVTRPVCDNIYTGVACTRPSLRPCTPLRGSRSPPRFLKISKEIGLVVSSIVTLAARILLPFSCQSWRLRCQRMFQYRDVDRY